MIHLTRKIGTLRPARMTERYGARLPHAVAMAGCFALAAYAALQLLNDRPIAVAAWFIGAALIHDLVLLPAYTIADHVMRRRQPHDVGRAPVMSWINYLRVPAFLSALLLLVWFPLILNISGPYHGATALPENVYLARWLIISAAMFAISALILGLRMNTRRRADTTSDGSSRRRRGFRATRSAERADDL
jgi:hypothetical protein